MLADRLHRLYRSRGVLALDGLEGSFTLALLDGESGRLLLYRNLAGAGFTSGFFGSSARTSADPINPATKAKTQIFFICISSCCLFY